MGKSLAASARRGSSKLIAVVLVACFAAINIVAADTDWEMEPMSPDLNDVESLQRGLALYANFCIGCHSLQYQRYERTAQDLGEIPHDLMLQNVVFSGQPIGGYMTTSMSTEDAKAWFGATPPDLTMVTRVRSPEWVYNFLKTFYIDESRPFGVNNKVFPNVGMPHVLLPLQGINDEVCYGYKSVDVMQRLVEIDAAIAEGNADSMDRLEGRELNCPELELRAGTGLYSEEEFDQVAKDIANFLHYMGDPSRQARTNLGFYVIGFLLILLVLAYFLNREYWKDIHGRRTTTTTSST